MLSDLNPVVLMLAMLLATTSIWRCNAICRESEMSCAFSIAHIPVLHPRTDLTSPSGPFRQFTLQKLCQSKKLNDFMEVQHLPGSVDIAFRVPAARLTRQILPLWDSW